MKIMKKTQFISDIFDISYCFSLLSFKYVNTFFWTESKIRGANKIIVLIETKHKIQLMGCSNSSWEKKKKYYIIFLQYICECAEIFSCSSSCANFCWWLLVFLMFRLINLHQFFFLLFFFFFRYKFRSRNNI